MNPILAHYLQAEFFGEYQALRDQLLDVISDSDLDYRVGAASPTLGALCREIGEIEHSYIDVYRDALLIFYGKVSVTSRQ